MALTSPGVQVTIVDESNYLPAATNSVPYFLIATAQDKVSGSGVGVAAGTLKANANKHRFERQEVETTARDYLDALDVAVEEDRAQHGKKP